MDYASIFDPDELERLAEAGPGAGDDAGIHTASVQDQVLALGLLAEEEPELARELCDSLAAPARALAQRSAAALLADEIDSVEATLAAADAATPALFGPPLLSADPEATEAFQDRLFEARVSRERIERCRHALRALAPEAASAAATDASDLALAGLDARLVAQAPRLEFLAPRCSGALAALPAELAARRLWFADVIRSLVEREAAEEALAESDPDTADGAPTAWQRWLAARWAGPGEPLRLDRDEARALLRDPAWPALARYLDESVDVSAGLWSEEEVAEACGDETLADLLQPAAEPVGVWEWLLEEVRSLGWHEEAEWVPELAAAAAAAGGRKILAAGLDAPPCFVAERAHLVPGLGLVAQGYELGERGNVVRPAWLVARGADAVGPVTMRLEGGEDEPNTVTLQEAPGDPPLWLLVRKTEHRLGLAWTTRAGQQRLSLLDLTELGAAPPGDQERALLAFLGVLRNQVLVERVVVEWDEWSNELDRETRDDLRWFGAVAQTLAREE